MAPTRNASFAVELGTKTGTARTIKVNFQTLP